MSETSFEKLSVCIITRDQCSRLEKCLKAVKSYLPGADIAVLDTGSHDDSLEMAAKYTDNTGTFEWCDDFSKAKNACMAQAKNDLVLVLDSDEYMEEGEERYGSLISLYKKYPGAVGRIRRKNSFVNDRGQKVCYEEWINRVFDRRLFHYEGRIHEQLNSLSGKEIKTYKTDIRAFHDGYDLEPEEKKKKAERNASLLLKEMGEKADDPYLCYQLGKTFFVSENKEKAALYLTKALELKPDPGMEYMEDLLCLTGYALLDTGKAAEAFSTLKPFREQRRYGNNADFMFLYGLILMNTLKFDEARETFVFCTSLPPSNTEGTSSYLAWYNAGVISEVLGDKRSAAMYYGRAGDFERAAEGKKRCMK